MARRLLVGTAAAIMVTGLASAAEIRLEGNNADGIPIVSVKGDFIERDIERFADVTKDLPNAMISFSSNGGNLSTGIEIGTRIRFRGYTTVVADGEECYSACALAWLGGTTRYVGQEAQIGFHAAYLEKDGRFQETGVGNAVVGGYAANLGLRTEAIIFITSAPPDDYRLLTENLAQRLGIVALFGDFAKLIEPKISQTNDQTLVLLGFRQMAIHGDVGAQIILGDEFAAEGPLQDYAEAMYWYGRAAERGAGSAQFKLGFMYANGRGVRQDQGEAVRWYRKAADQGHVEAQYNLGVRYDTGQGVRQNHAEAVGWYREAADQGHVGAQFNLGISYANGEGVRQDQGEAVRWYRKAADQGHVEAQYNLGVRYVNGRGVRQNHAEAVRWFRKAADQGLAHAQFNLGVRYDTGQGVRQNHAEAVGWYRKAADQGHDGAQFNLGVSFSLGEGVPQDLVFAHMWYNLAASNGHQDGRVNRDRTARQMSPGQIAEAQRLAREWRPK